MNIGIIVHSQSGHTLLVANKLHNQLQQAGHSVSLERIAAVNDKITDVKAIKLKSIPNLNQYDVVILGAPVHGFALSIVMQAFLHQLPDTKNKVVMGYVTQFFPHPSMGGNQAIQQLTTLCHDKNLVVSRTGIVNWLMPRGRKRLIEQVVHAFVTSIE